LHESQIRDHALGSWVAGAIFQFGQTIEQFVYQFLLRLISQPLVFHCLKSTSQPISLAQYWWLLRHLLLAASE
jgi:hypothetical protein